MIEHPEGRWSDVGEGSLDIQDVEVGNVFLAHAIGAGCIDQCFEESRAAVLVTFTFKECLDSSETAGSALVASRGRDFREKSQKELREVPVEVPRSGIS